MRVILFATAAFVALLTGQIRAETTNDSGSLYRSEGAVKPATQIDRLIFPRLQKLGIEPVLCSDAVFVRRAYLDVIGTIPEAAEASAFIESKDPAKREKLVDDLLQREQFADYWSMKWGDILRIKAEFPVNLWPNAAQAYHHWVRTSIYENKPYDRFARELLTSSGSNFRVGPVNFYRAVQNRTPEGIASAVALTFMGARADRWPKDQLTGMAAFFSQVGYKPTREWKEEIVYWDPFGTIAAGTNTITYQNGVPQTSAPTKGAFPGEKSMNLPSDRDPREVFADWLIRRDNPWFARSIVNRVWYWVMGRGIIQEPDDIRTDNPPSNPSLLSYLEKDFVGHNYDLKYLYRSILNSRVYQLASVPGAEKEEAESEFGVYPLRRLEAEVLIDAINKITGTSDLYTSAIPEPFTYIPKEATAVSIADGSITSPFLTLFGRSARATGMENERSNKVMPQQALHLLNSSHIQTKLEQSPKLGAIISAKATPREIMDKLYLTILARYPTPEEVQTLGTYGHRNNKGAYYKTREDWLDIAWALVNSTEFLHRH